MQVTRVLNNNTILASRSDGTRVVLMGKGLGFGAKLGDPVNLDRVQHTFVPDDANPLAALTHLVGDLPIEVLGLAATIVQDAHARAGVSVSQSLLLALADHLNFALTHPELRSQAYPLAWEVSQLFPTEMGIGNRALDMVRDQVGTQLQASEATAIALHFVNAQFAVGDMSRTEHMARRIHQVLGVVSATLGHELDHQTMSVMRFVTHLRYLFTRLEQHTQIADAPATLGEALAHAHPAAYRAAQRVREVLEMDGDVLTADEVTYLTLHIARLTTPRP